LTYAIQFERAAIAALEAIPKRDRERIVAKIELLEGDPRPPGSKALAGAPGLHRIRVGHYRAIYRIHDDVLVVIVVKIGHRREVYRRLP
jgi:mRNA interferase RelE/StbE